MDPKSAAPFLIVLEHKSRNLIKLKNGAADFESSCPWYCYFSDDVGHMKHMLLYSYIVNKLFMCSWIVIMCHLEVVMSLAELFWSGARRWGSGCWRTTWPSTACGVRLTPCAGCAPGYSRANDSHTQIHPSCMSRPRQASVTIFLLGWSIILLDSQ